MSSHHFLKLETLGRRRAYALVGINWLAVLVAIGLSFAEYGLRVQTNVLLPQRHGAEVSVDADGFSPSSRFVLATVVADVPHGSSEFCARVPPAAWRAVVSSHAARRAPHTRHQMYDTHRLSTGSTLLVTGSRSNAPTPLCRSLLTTASALWPRRSRHAHCSQQTSLRHTMCR